MTTDGDIQIDDGDFTRIHNEILGKLAIARLTASEYRCLFFLFRMTYGWQKKEDRISLSQWAAGVGISETKRHNVLRTLQSLVAKNVIYTKSNGNNRPATWGFNKRHKQWDASLFDETVISPDNSSDPKTVMPPDNSLPPTVISPDNKTVISLDNNKRKKESSKAAAAAAMPDPYIESYQRIWALMPESEYRTQVIGEWAQRVTLQVWEYALKECADNSKVGQWRYLEAILKRLEHDGLPSLNGAVPPAKSIAPTVISVPR